MIARTQAVVLGGLVSVAAFCTCICLAAPVAAFAALFEIGDHNCGTPWVRPRTVFGASFVVGTVAAAAAGHRVGRDWYRTARNPNGPSNSPES